MILNPLRIARCWCIKREIDRGVARQRTVRLARRDAALRGMEKAR